MLSKLIESSLLSTLGQVFNKSIGLISTIILARILTPEDFGLIAIVSIVLYFFEVISNTGIEQYLIRKKTVSNEDINTAWTSNLLIKLVIMLAIIACAPLVGAFLGKAQIILALQVATLVLFLNALVHPKLIVLKRQLKYRFITLISLLQKIITFIIVIPLAFVLENFWAFVIADIFGSLFLMTVSHMMVLSAPSLSLKRFRLQWSFSKWILGKNILGYCRSQMDVIMVSKMFNNRLVGNYSMAKEIAMLPGQHILSPAIEPLLASFKDSLKDVNSLLSKFNKSLTVVSLAASPICIFTLIHADSLALVLLGEQWQSTGAILSIFSVLCLYWINLLLLESVLTAMGKVRLLFAFDAVSFSVTLLVLLFAFYSNFSILETAKLRVASGVTLTLLESIAVLYILNGKWLAYIARVIWPLTLATLLGVGLLPILSIGQFEFLSLLANATLYLTSYVGAVFLILRLTHFKIAEHNFILSLFPFSKR